MLRTNTAQKVLQLIGLLIVPVFGLLGLVTPPPIGERSIVMSESARDHIFGTTYLTFIKFLCMAVAGSFSGGVMIRYILPVLWMTSYLLISQGCSTSQPSWSAVHTQPLAWL